MDIMGSVFQASQPWRKVVVVARMVVASWEEGEEEEEDIVGAFVRKM